MIPPSIERLEREGLRFYLDGCGALRWRHYRRLTTEERAAVAENRDELVAQILRVQPSEKLAHAEMLEYPTPRTADEFPRIAWAVRRCEGCAMLFGFRCRHESGPGFKKSDGWGCERFTTWKGRIMEIQETLSSYMVFAAEWSTSAQKAQRQLDREIGRIRKKIKMLEVSTKDIEQRWVERLITGASTVRRPPRHMEKLERWRGVLEALRPMQKVSLTLSQEKYEFSALIGSCERTCGYLAESQERLEKFQALANSFPDDRGFAEQAKNEAAQGGAGCLTV